MQSVPPRQNVESLEPRYLFSSAVLMPGGLLSIAGDANVDDVVTVGLSAGGDKIDVVINGGAPQSFPKANVRSVAFTGRSGDDTFTVLESNGPFGIAVRFSGGGGDDVFQGGSEKDWAWGDGGDDILILGNGAN